MGNHSQDKTTIRLSEEDRDLLEKLGKLLAHKFGKITHLSHSDVIRYSLRQTAEREFKESQVQNDG